MIRFNKPHTTGKEIEYIKDALEIGKLSGNGKYTKLCHTHFEEKYDFGKCLLTTSCTDALEMCAILADIQTGDEVIMPSYTFVSTSNAFILHGAKIVFADSEPNFPNIDASTIEALITDKTKAIVVVHYAGISCDMDAICAIAKKHNILVIEDAAQGIDSYYNGKALGSIGDLAAFSFHETKNIISGEGGMLVVNNKDFIERSEIIWEKGTNRAAFYRGETDKYTWVDKGSSFLPSEMIAAFLYAQLEQTEDIQKKRLSIWDAYREQLQPLGDNGTIELYEIPEDCTNNAHLFYILTKDLAERDKMLKHFQSNSIGAVFHYLTLHNSPFFQDQHDGRDLPNATKFADRLIRLPLHYSLTSNDINTIVKSIYNFYNQPI